MMYRVDAIGLQVFLAHNGGPIWCHIDEHGWTIPKGEIEDIGQVSDRDFLLQEAIREYQEETSLVAMPPFLDLGSVKQKSGKIVYAWAFEGDWDGAPIKSNTFLMEWPKGSGKKQEFPECDRANYFTVSEAKGKINPAQFDFILRLVEILGKRV